MDRVVLNHVTYRYPIAEENALNDVSLRIQREILLHYRGQRRERPRSAM